MRTPVRRPGWAHQEGPIARGKRCRQLSPRGNTSSEIEAGVPAASGRTASCEIARAFLRPFLGEILRTHATLDPIGLCLALGTNPRPNSLDGERGLNFRLSSGAGLPGSSVRDDYGPVPDEVRRILCNLLTTSGQNSRNRLLPNEPAMEVAQVCMTTCTVLLGVG